MVGKDRASNDYVDCAPLGLVKIIVSTQGQGPVLVDDAPLELFLEEAYYSQIVKNRSSKGA